jgi:hypothetical protein
MPLGLPLEIQIGDPVGAIDADWLGWRSVFASPSRTS